MLDALAHLAQPMPEWLAALTPDGIQAGPSLWRRELLEDALVYPGSGDDGSPIRQLNGIVRSFIFLDLGTAKETYVDALTKRRKTGQGFAHHELVGITEFDAAEFIGPSLWLLPAEQVPREDGTPGFGLWAVYESTLRGAPERFSLLILHVEAISALAALYPWSAPFAVVAQDHSYGTSHWQSFSGRIRRLSQSWVDWPRLLIVAEGHHLGDWTTRGHLVCEDLAAESQNKDNRQFYELPTNLEPEPSTDEVAIRPKSALMEAMAQFLVDRLAPPEELREILSWLVERPVPDELVPRIVVAYDHLIWANEVDAVVLAWWPTLVSVIAPSLAHGSAGTADGDVETPNLRAWAMNRAAARTLLDSPAWQKHFNDEAFVALRQIADPAPEDVVRELRNSADLRVSEEQLAAWSAADTPERRWVERSRLHKARADLGDEADATPVLSDLERRALMETPTGIVARGRRCPDCRTEDHVRWFLVSQAQEELARGEGEATWMAVCTQCRVRLMVLDARRRQRTATELAATGGE